MEELHRDINSELFSLLDIDTIIKLSKTNKEWNRISKDRRYWVNYLNDSKYIIDIPISENYIEWYYNLLNKYNPDYQIYFKFVVNDSINFSDMAKIVYYGLGYDKEILGFNVDKIYYKSNDALNIYYKHSNHGQRGINQFLDDYNKIFADTFVDNIYINVDWIVTNRNLDASPLSLHVIDINKIGMEDIYYSDVEITYYFDDNSQFIYEEFFNDIDSYEFNNYNN